MGDVCIQVRVEPASGLVEMTCVGCGAVERESELLGFRKSLGKFLRLHADPCPQIPQQREP